MLKKLLKYDLKYMLKNMSIFYILAIFFAITTRILYLLEQTVIINVICKISEALLITMIANIIFNTIIRSWVRFNDSIYKDESYLTHTLPVTKTQIYESRFIQSLLFTIVGFIIVIISLFISYYTKDNWITITNIANSISNGLNLNTSFIIIAVVFILFLEIFNILQSGFLGLIIGNRENNNKIAYSFLFGFVCYMISQFIVILFIFIFGIFNTNIMSVFTSSSIIDNSIIKTLAILSIITYTFNIALMNVICLKLFKKGVNV